ncbi:hypothetical protein M0805_006741 [Coniferiporia weirii]|nr:hypothetical protein M0805_006741 [Coniferiporia weirii]
MPSPHSPRLQSLRKLKWRGGPPTALNSSKQLALHLLPSPAPVLAKPSKEAYVQPSEPTTPTRPRRPTQQTSGPGPNMDWGSAPPKSLPSNKGTAPSPNRKKRKVSFSAPLSSKNPPPIPDVGLPPTPPPPPLVPPLLTSELEAALADTSNLSAPGPSGISYCPLKWVIMHYPDEVLTLFNDCLHLGHHPECWRAAKVVMLRKLNKKDPFSPRSYRPITLEETLGKLLEKIIANRLQFLANEEDWLPPNQYGGRQGHSVYNASQHLLQIVECAHSKGLVCSILVVDIQGFFDSVHPTLLHQQLVSMGCPLNMADWCLSFMTGQSVSISFNRTTLPTAPKPDLGTPQGSLVSPILSTIFAGLALWCFQQPGCNLLAYVDDHLIVCTGPNIASNYDTLAAAYHQLDGHFLRLGLNIEAAKTEALHFHPP